MITVPQDLSDTRSVLEYLYKVTDQIQDLEMKNTKFQVKIEKMTLQQDIEIEQIGEDYLASVKAKKIFEQSYTDYVYEVSGNALVVWRKADEKKKAVLYVEAELTADEQLNVSAWRYSLPIATE